MKWIIEFFSWLSQRILSIWAWFYSSSADADKTEEPTISNKVQSFENKRTFFPKAYLKNKNIYQLIDEHYLSGQWGNSDDYRVLIANFTFSSQMLNKDQIAYLQQFFEHPQCPSHIRSKLEIFLKYCHIRNLTTAELQLCRQALLIYSGFPENQKNDKLIAVSKQFSVINQTKYFELYNTGNHWNLEVPENAYHELRSSSALDCSAIQTIIKKEDQTHYVLDVAGDGDCFYHAFNAGLAMQMFLENKPALESQILLQWCALHPEFSKYVCISENKFNETYEKEAEAIYQAFIEGFKALLRGKRQNLLTPYQMDLRKILSPIKKDNCLLSIDWQETFIDGLFFDYRAILNWQHDPNNKILQSNLKELALNPYELDFKNKKFIWIHLTPIANASIEEKKQKIQDYIIANKLEKYHCIASFTDERMDYSYEPFSKNIYSSSEMNAYKRTPVISALSDTHADSHMDCSGNEEIHDFFSAIRFYYIRKLFKYRCKADDESLKLAASHEESSSPSCQPR